MIRITNLLALCLFLMLFVVTGCGENDSSEGTGEVSPSDSDILDIDNTVEREPDADDVADGDILEIDDYSENESDNGERDNSDSDVSDRDILETDDNTDNDSDNGELEVDDNDVSDGDILEVDDNTENESDDGELDNDDNDLADSDILETDDNADNESGDEEWDNSDGDIADSDTPDTDNTVDSEPDDGEYDGENAENEMDVESAFSIYITSPSPETQLGVEETITVTGTLSHSLPLDQLEEVKVNGIGAILTNPQAMHSEWTANEVPVLSYGDNLITASATDSEGRNVEHEIHVDRQFTREQWLQAYASQVEQNMMGWDASTFPDLLQDYDTLEIHWQGMAWCNPETAGGSLFANPSGDMNPPTSRYGCDQQVDVEFIANQNQVIAILTIPYHHFDMYFSAASWIGDHEGYSVSTPTTIQINASLEGWPDYPHLKYIDNSVEIDFHEFRMTSESSFMNTMLEALYPAYESLWESIFEDHFNEHMERILGWPSNNGDYSESLCSNEWDDDQDQLVDCDDPDCLLSSDCGFTGYECSICRQGFTRTCVTGYECLEDYNSINTDNVGMCVKPCRSQNDCPIGTSCSLAAPDYNRQYCLQNLLGAQCINNAVHIETESGCEIVLQCRNDEMCDSVTTRCVPLE